MFRLRGLIGVAVPVVVLAVLVAFLAPAALADNPSPDPAPAATPKPDPAPTPAAPDPAPQPPPPPPSPPPPPPPVYIPPPPPSPAPQPPPPPAPAKKAPAKPKKNKKQKVKPAKARKRIKHPKADAPIVIRLKHGKRMIELRDTPKPSVPKDTAPHTTGVVPITAVSTPGGSGSVPWLFLGPLALALLALGAAALPRRTLAASSVLRMIEPRRLDLAISAFIVLGSVLIALAVTHSG